MEMQASKSPHPLVWVAAIALIVFCGAGAAAFLGWIPTSMGKPAEDAALAKVDKPKATPAKVAGTQVAAAKAPAAAVAAVKCAECGVIQSVREIETKGEGSGIGVVGGAVAGGLLGNQIGGGDGKKIMTVVGAVGGAVAGNEIEKRVRSAKSYEITVRFDNGSSRVISEANAPTWRQGDKVKVVNGVIQSNA
jgi:outer membrane lipoprotein SlyB